MDIKLSDRDKKLWKMLQFFVRLIILSVPLYLVIYLAIDLTVLQNWFAGMSAAILSAFGWSVSVNGSVVSITAPAQFTFLIDPDCTAWKSILFLFALIFAVPRKNKS